MNRLLGVGAWGIGCLIVCAFAVEATVRFDDWAQHGVPISSGVTGMSDLLTTDNLGMHPAANRQYRYFRSNNLGFRGPDVTQKSLNDRALVVTAGASETFGLYESPDHEWPRVLEKDLAAICPAPSPLVQNAGFAGMSLPTIAQDIRLRLSRVHPRVIVLYPTPAQYLEPWLPKAKLPTTVAPPAVSSWSPRSMGRFRDAVKAVVPEQILDWLRRRSLQTSRMELGSKVWSAPPPERLEAYEAELRRVVGAIRAIGATPVLGVHQHRFRDTLAVAEQRWLKAWERFYPNATGATLLQFEALAGERTRKVATDSAVTLVDPSPRFATGSSLLFADFVHFTDAGAKIMAEEMAAGVGAALGCTPGGESPAHSGTFQESQSPAPSGDTTHRSR